MRTTKHAKGEMTIFRVVSAGGVAALFTDKVLADWLERNIPKKWGLFWLESFKVEKDLSVFKALNRPFSEIVEKNRITDK